MYIKTFERRAVSIILGLSAWAVLGAATASEAPRESVVPADEPSIRKVVFHLATPDGETLDEGQLRYTIWGPLVRREFGKRVEVRNGRAELEVLTSADRTTCLKYETTDHDLFWTVVGTTIEVPPGAAPLEIDVLLSKAQVVRGIVVDEAGKSLPGIEVFAQGPDEYVASNGRRVRYACNGWAQTDAAGRFKIGGLPLDQSYSVYAHPENLERARTPAQTLTLTTETASSHELRFVVRRGRDLKIHVADAERKPVQGAWLNLRFKPRDGSQPREWGSLFTGPRGIGVFQRLNDQLDGEWSVHVHAKDGFKAQTLPVNPETFQMGITLTKGGVLTGVVRHDETGAQLAGKAVFANPMTDGKVDRTQSHIQTKTDAAGRFRLEGLNEGAYEIIVINVALRGCPTVGVGGEAQEIGTLDTVGYPKWHVAFPLEHPGQVEIRGLPKK